MCDLKIPHNEREWCYLKVEESVKGLLKYLWNVAHLATIATCICVTQEY